MQIIILLLLACVCSSAAVMGTQASLTDKRDKRKNLILLCVGIIVCLCFSVLTEIILRAGKPTFYYHIHRPGRTTVKLFGCACISGSVWYALFLMIAERKRAKKLVRVWLARSALLGICAAGLLEVFYFNFRHFELIGANAPEVHFPSERLQEIGLYFNRASWKFHPYTWTEDHRFIIYTGNKKIRNINIPMDDGTPRPVVSIGFNDNAHRDHVTLPDRTLIRGIQRSFNIPIHTVGKTYSLLVRLPDVKEKRNIPDYGISLPEIVINQTVPLEIDPIRFILCFLAVFLMAAFFPGSPLWSLNTEFSSLPQILSAAGLLCLSFLAFGWTVFSSYTGSEKSFSEQKGVLNENYQQYYKLVDALMVPRYALLDEPHRYLEQLDDPYDMKQREGKQFDYPWDTAYYQGRFYVYFGVVPAAAVLLPWKLVTGNYLELDHPILAFCCLTVLGLYGIYSLLVRRYFQRISFGLYWMGLLVLITSLNLTWCLRRTLVYELAITSGVCFSVWGIFFMLLAGRCIRIMPFCFFLSGICSALAVGCRPTNIFVSAVVFTAAIPVLKDSGNRKKALKFRDICLFLIPYLAIGASLMKYNYERFQDPFEFGITYQLTTENRAAGIPLLGPYGRILSVLSSLFTVPRVDMNFPFFHPQTPELPYNGVILNSDTVTGVFAYSVMLFLFTLPVFRKRLKTSGLFPLFCVCLIAALMICVTASGYAVANRYLTDYLYLLAVPAVFLMFCFYEKCEEKSCQRPAELAVLVCGCFGVCLFLMLSVTGEEDWFRRINPMYFDQLRYALSPWL